MINWSLLGIEPTDDINKIKSAYALKAKEYHPEEQPEKFRELHASYKEAVAAARKQRKTQSAPAKSQCQPEYENFTPEYKKNDLSFDFADKPTHNDEVPVDNDKNPVNPDKDDNPTQDSIIDRVDAEIKKQNSEYIVGIDRLLKILDMAFSQQNILKISYAVNEIKDSDDFKKYKDDRRFLRALCDYLKSKNYKLKTLSFICNLYDIDVELNGSNDKYVELAEIINEQAQIESAQKTKRRNKIIKAVSIAASAAVIILRLLIRNDVFSGI